jgi:hypothetical protein
MLYLDAIKTGELAAGAAPDLIRGEHRFSEKFTLKQQSKVKQ